MDYTFQPEYLFEFEIEAYGLPSAQQLPTVMNLVDAASSLIDTYCGRISGEGAGSLVYSTYVERELLPVGRNLCRVSQPPLVAVDTATVNALASYNLTGYLDAGSGVLVTGNHFYTGVLPNTVTVQGQPGGNLSSIISASGRYGYGRRDQQATYPDLNYGANILQVAAFFGGPPQWTGIDASMIDVNPAVGELWLPAGLYLSSYTEVIVTYNAGFNPIGMPNNIKMATAALVKNFITRSGGVTGLNSYSAGRIHAAFTPNLVDPTIEQWLRFFSHVVSV